jgi:hypothetical protein
VTDEVDLDRLADYVGGALDDTPDAEAVAHLVATDDRWASAHAALVAADSAVRADLAALAATPEPMPGDVMTRLTAAFEAEAERPRLTVLPGGGGESAPRRARRRWGPVIGVAATVAVLGVGVVSVLPQLDESSDKSTAGISADNRATSPQVPGSGETPAPLLAFGQTRASGSDYDANSLSTLGAQTTGAGPKATQPDAAGSGPGVRSAPESSPTALNVPPALQRLAQPEGRTACVDAILAEYGGTVSLLDYARYKGEPALVVVLDGALKVPDRKWVVVVGPNCGTGGAIADQKFSAQIG